MESHLLEHRRVLTDKKRKLRNFFQIEDGDFVGCGITFGPLFESLRLREQRFLCIWKLQLPLNVVTEQNSLETPSTVTRRPKQTNLSGNKRNGMLLALLHRYFEESLSKDADLVCQPWNSPDWHVLDLGFFNSIQSLRHESIHSNMGELSAFAEQPFARFSHMTFNYVFLSLQKVMAGVILCQGRNNSDLE